MFVLDVRYVASFWNQNASKATGVDNPGQISHFLTPPPCKNEGGMYEMLRVNFSCET